MIRALAVLTLLILSPRVEAAAAEQVASPAFLPPQRQAYVREALSALRSTPLQTLENLYQFVRIVQRNSCRGPAGPLTLACIHEAAQQNCKTTTGRFKARCPVLSDIVVVNQMNADKFITREEHLRAARQTQGAGSSQVKLLSRKYGLLSAEFLLLSEKDCGSEGDACLARELDQYCLRHADVKNIPWQACVAAVTWFIGISK